MRSEQYPTGAMRQCTHDAAIEGRFDSFEVPDSDHTSSHAQNSSIRAESDADEKGLADESAALEVPNFAAGEKSTRGPTQEMKVLQKTC